jgi:hypothetical protein
LHWLPCEHHPPFCCHPLFVVLSLLLCYASPSHHHPPPCHCCECLPMAVSARNPPCKQFLTVAGVLGSSLGSLCHCHPCCHPLVMVAWSLHCQGSCSCSVCESPLVVTCLLAPTSPYEQMHTVVGGGCWAGPSPLSVVFSWPLAPEIPMRAVAHNGRGGCWSLFLMSGPCFPLAPTFHPVSSHSQGQRWVLGWSSLCPPHLSCIVSAHGSSWRMCQG